MARVVIENLGKVFAGARGEPIHALRDASFAVEDKEFVVLVGPSGCGKSTTLRLLAGLETVSRGKISIDGQVVNELPPKDRDIAMVFQNYALFPHLTVFENMALGLKLRKVPKTEVGRRVEETASILGLSGCLDRKPQSLSGGERQRVSLGRAIVRRPKVLLLDEPLSNLDAQLRVQMRTELARLHARLQATIIHVTHDQAEAMTLGNRIVVMKDGCIQQVAEPLTVYEHPASLFVAGFIGLPPMNFFHGRLLWKGSTLWFAAGAAADAPGGFVVALPAGASENLGRRSGSDVVLGLRPEAISLAQANSLSPAQAGLAAIIQARVEVIEPMGPETHLYLSTGNHRFVARVEAGDRVEPAQVVAVSLELRKARFFDPQTETAL